MHVIGRSQLEPQRLPGRTLQKGVGGPGEGPIQSGKMTVGFARYSEESGPMQPHQHAEETIYVVGARDGWVRFGPAPDRLGEPIRLEAGMLLHSPDLEWHVFEYEEHGFVDALYIYGQIDNIRPEQISR